LPGGLYRNATGERDAGSSPPVVAAPVDPRCNAPMRIPALVGALLLCVLGGCSLLRPSPSAPGAPAQKVSLADEQRRLAELFRGTPVVFEMQADGSMRVTVPLRYSFDKGRFAVKPPLGAVLDRVAKSQRAEATRFLVQAPADPQSKGLLLATERATSARDYLVGRGVDATRFSIAAAGSGDAVVIVVADVAAH
jgi:outer membrane protein OmpA-like peptidoglycan-associated protein